MLKDQRMIMVGSTGRNSGKTTFSTEFIKKYKDDKRIFALKVTTIEKRDMKCPRGGEGCGVCTSLVGNYDIREELARGQVKDTQRLKDAGAERVFWIRAYPEYLEEAYQDFLDLAEEADLIICESNSLRAYLEPRTFIMIDNSKKPKSSAENVRHLADMVVGQLDEEGARDLANKLDLR